jgi:hypothetical protein
MSASEIDINSSDSSKYQEKKVFQSHEIQPEYIINPQNPQYIDYDITKNKNQQLFVKNLLKAIVKKSPHRYFFYGGGIRGGKTTAALFGAIIYAILYKGVRIHIIRQSIPVLENTTIASLKQMLSIKHIKTWSRKQIEFHNKSKILFMAEAYRTDPDLNKFKGLETNMIILDQLEELSFETFNKCIERVGTYKHPENPPGIIISTFNPTFSWLKEKIYEPYLEGKLPPTYYYQHVLPIDNKENLPQEIFKQWETMDPISYKRFVLGDWNARDPSGLFAYAFEPQRSVKPLEMDPNLPLWLSFDFNVNPMTALLCQITKDKSQFHVLQEFYKENTGITEFTQYIKSKIPKGHPLFITGDPAGKNRNALARANTNYYIEIRNVLRMPKEHFQVMNYHPTHENSWVLCNKIFHNHQGFFIDPSCKLLIQDLNNVKMMEDGNIEKDRRITATSPTIGHLLDCLRYIIHLHFWNGSISNS